MTSRAPQALNGGQHLILYDGVCGLCDRFTQFVLSHDPQGIFHYASLQSPVAGHILERWGHNPLDLNTVIVVVNYRTTRAAMLKKGRAIQFVLHTLGWPWRVASALSILPQSVVNFAYDMVARNRYRMFGRFDECRLPRPDERARFIDLQGDAGDAP